MSASEEINTKLMDELEALVRRLRGRELKSARDLWKFQNDIVQYRINISKEISNEAAVQQVVKDRVAEVVERKGAGWKDEARELYGERDRIKERIDTYSRAAELSKQLADALVWMLLGFDEQKIGAQSINHPNPSLPQGLSLHGMLAVAESLASAGLGFPVINDLTNCLRVGDITFIHPEGEPLPVEVKTGEPINVKGDTATLPITWYYVGNSERFKRAMEKLRDKSLQVRESLAEGEQAAPPPRRIDPRLRRQLERMAHVKAFQEARHGEPIEALGPEYVPVVPVGYKLCRDQFHWDTIRELADKAKVAGHASRAVDGAFLYSAIYIDKSKIDTSGGGIRFPFERALAEDRESLLPLCDEREKNCISTNSTLDYLEGEVTPDVRPLFTYPLPVEQIVDLLRGRLIFLVEVNVGKVVEALGRAGLRARMPAHEVEFNELFISVSKRVDLPGGDRLEITNRDGTLKRLAAKIVYEFLSLDGFVSCVSQTVEALAEVGKARAAADLRAGRVTGRR